jgi:hypothetical protein
MALGKQARTAEQLRVMVQVRMDDLPEVRRRVADGRAAPVVGLPTRISHDHFGRSWDMPAPQHGVGLLATFREIVDALRETYDLA